MREAIGRKATAVYTRVMVGAIQCDRKLFPNRARRVTAFHWKPGRGRSFCHNFGDDLFGLIWRRLGGPEGICIPSWMHFRKKILIGGSVLHFAFNEDVVWGAGVRDPTAPHFFQSLDVCAVRGKMTEEFLQARGIRCTGVCGDPGILVGDLFPEVRGCTRDVELGVIPHYSDFEKFARIYNESENIEVIDPRRKAQDVIADIARCGLIVSSSLHGLIVADALGIPSKWAMPSKAESKFKYLDYYSIGENVPVCHSSIEQAVSSKSGVSRFYIPPDRTDALRQSFGAVLEGL